MPLTVKLVLNDLLTYSDQAHSGAYRGPLVATRYSQYRRVEAASFEQRAEPRLKLSITRASVRRHGKTPIDALLHDLSSYGCRIASGVEAEQGERLWLRFDGRMPIAATVIWCIDGMVGCRFDEPIERAMMRALTLRIV